MDRRRFLQATVAAGAGLALWPDGGLGPSPAGAAAPAPFHAATGGVYVPSPWFPGGVLSGDPLPGAVMLWTRPDPSLDTGSGIATGWEVATEPSFASGTVVASGSASAEAARDHCVTVDVGGLDPATTYWYRFEAGGHLSPVGRTRTAPDPGDDDAEVRFAFFSCQRWMHGWYPVHAWLAGLAADPATDLAFVISLGDYVYDTGPADDFAVDGRVDPVLDAVTLDDFRAKYRLYRTDVNLQAMQANYPLLAIFDNHDGLSGPWDDTGPGAIGAFFEHMPIRPPGGDPQRIHRSLRWGQRAEVILLDERRFRDPQVPQDNELGSSSVDRPEMFDPDRTMLGADQLGWLLDRLASPAQWKVLGSQLVFAPFRGVRYPDVAAADPVGQRNAGLYVNMTAWDGYQGERQKILDHLAASGIDDTLVLAGDAHFWTASEIQTDWDDPDAPYVCTELGGSSVSSANADEMGLPGTDVLWPVLTEANPQSLRFFEAETHGVTVVRLGPAGASARFVATETVREPTSVVSDLATFEIAAGTNRITGSTGTPTTTTTGVTGPTPAGATPGGGTVRPAATTPRFTG